MADESVTRFRTYQDIAEYLGFVTVGPIYKRIKEGKLRVYPIYKEGHPFHSPQKRGPYRIVQVSKCYWKPKDKKPLSIVTTLNASSSWIKPKDFGKYLDTDAQTVVHWCGKKEITSVYRNGNWFIPRSEITKILGDFIGDRLLRVEDAARSLGIRGVKNRLRFNEIVRSGAIRLIKVGRYFTRIPSAQLGELRQCLIQK